MWISGFQVTDFSTFKDTGWLELNPGINLFIGQNNSGKSALLRALSLQIKDNPHRSPEAYSAASVGRPSVRITIAITPTEIVNRLNELGINPVFPRGDGQRAGSGELARILNSPDAIVQLEGVKGTQTTNIQPVGRASISTLRSENNQNYARVSFSKSGSLVVAASAGNERDNLLSFLDSDKSEAIFYFSPERLNVARYGFATETRLRSDASNLPAVLAYLQGSRRLLFDKIESQLAEIMPGVSRITVTPSENVFEILIWPDRNTDRRELAFSLQESGTGVGQLLAILTTLAVSDQAIIIIDEINTFLHPSAAKKLMGLLRSDYSRHQYIISTHSPDVISSAATDKVIIINREGFVSRPEPVDLTDIESAKGVAHLLGFSMMDVFGHERIVWVEGITEELCFPFLARKMPELELDGIGFSAVASTDAFSGRKASDKAIVNLYDAVALKVAPLLKGMAFGLDRESLSDEAVLRLQRSKRKLRFLPRRSIECYCLNSETIAEHLNSLGEEKTVDEVASWLEANAGEHSYSAKSLWKGDLADVAWLKKVDAAKLLSDAFAALTSHRQIYRKSRDTFALLKLQVEQDKEALSELLEYIALLVEVAHRDTRA